LEIKKENEVLRVPNPQTRKGILEVAKLLKQTNNKILFYFKI